MSNDASRGFENMCTLVSVCIYSGGTIQCHKWDSLVEILHAVSATPRMLF